MGISAAKSLPGGPDGPSPTAITSSCSMTTPWPICDGWHKPPPAQPHLRANYAPAVSQWNQLWGT